MKTECDDMFEEYGVYELDIDDIHPDLPMKVSYFKQLLGNFANDIVIVNDIL